MPGVMPLRTALRVGRSREVYRLASHFIIGLIAFTLGVAASGAWVIMHESSSEWFALSSSAAVQKPDGGQLVGVSGLPVKLLVWNETERDIVIDVQVDGVVVYNAAVGAATQHPAIMVNEGHRLAPGIHRVVLTDRTRGVRREAKVLLADKAWVEVRLSEGESELLIRYQNVIYE